MASWAVYEPKRGFTPLAPQVRAERDSAGYMLTGVKDRVDGGDQADWFLVTAAGPDGLAQFLVPAGAPGVTVTAESSLDLVRHYAQVELDGVVAPDGGMGGGGDGGMGGAGLVRPAGPAEAAVNRQVQIAAALQCAETAGAAQRVFEFTVQWAFDRYSFGRPLASYQALKHRFADSKTWLEASLATASAAAWANRLPSPRTNCSKVNFGLSSSRIAPAGAATGSGRCAARPPSPAISTRACGPRTAAAEASRTPAKRSATQPRTGPGASTSSTSPSNPSGRSSESQSSNVASVTERRSSAWIRHQISALSGGMQGRATPCRRAFEDGWEKEPGAWCTALPADCAATITPLTEQGGPSARQGSQIAVKSARRRCAHGVHAMCT